MLLDRSAKSNVNPRLRAAEDEVSDSIARFEAAMNHLADKVDQTALRVRESVWAINRPLESIRAIAREVRKNPRLWIVTAASLFAAYLMLKSSARRNRSPVFF